ncbi:hypothetical protein ACLOJK_025835 [Asimina triloba]
MAAKALISVTILTVSLLCIVAVVSASDVLFPADAADLGNWMATNVKPLDARMSDGGEPLEAELVEAEKNRRVITVRQDGSGDFKTVMDAVNSVPTGNTNRTIIRIGPGTYKEKISVPREKPFLTFYGDKPNDMPVLTFDGDAAEYGTLGSASLTLESKYFMAVNIIVENTSPEPRPDLVGAQAVAILVGGDMSAFYNCKFYGFQDTVCDHMGRHFFKDCFIQGTVDYIFGSGKSIYLSTEMHSVGKGEMPITAQARKSADEDSGYSFIHCKITGTGDVVLGRAWKPRSTVVFAYTYMDSIVHPKGWDNFGFHDRNETVFFAEYECKGPGATLDGRVSFAKPLKLEQAKPYISTSYIGAGSWLLPPPTL